MSDYVVNTNDIIVMADAVIYVMEYARRGHEEFTFGPLDRNLLLTQGLFLMGDVDELVAGLQRTVKGVTIYQHSA